MRFRNGQLVGIPHLHAKGRVLYSASGEHGNLYIVAICGMLAHGLYEDELVELQPLAADMEHTHET